MLNVNEQIRRFNEFVEKYYLDTLLENVRKGNKFLKVDFLLLSKYDPELAEIIFEQPEEVFKAFEIALLQFDYAQKPDYVRVRFYNLPPSSYIDIRDIRAKEINKYFYVEGVVRQKSEIRPQVTSARFECPSCGNIMNVLQLDKKFKEPSRCPCGRSGKFRMISKELVDVQGLDIEEAPENLIGGEQPKRIKVFLKEDLVSPMSDKKTNPGTKIRVFGILKEVPIVLQTGGQSTRFDLIIEANEIEPIEEDFGELAIDEKTKQEILELSKDPKIIQKLIDSIAPSIYGHERVKEALVLQLFGGVRKQRSDGVVSRGDMHILLVGDPGSGKSQLLKRTAIVAPKARFVSGKGASGAGITASVVKDEFLKGWTLEAGALVLAHKGMCMIDELDKMSKEDRAAMHEALEQQTVTISKANIQATLRCETTVLAAANPKFGRFDPFELIAKQIDLPPSLINRFDLIFPIKDLPDKDRDDTMASFILNIHQTKKTGDAEIKTDLLRKYIAFARQNIVPSLTDSAVQEIKSYYVTLRSSGSDEGGIKSVPINARQLEGLIRLAEASARARLSDKVTKKDAKRAIELLDFCLRQIGVDPKTGKLDIDRISSGVTASERSKISVVKQIIAELEEKLGKQIPIKELVINADEKGIDSAEVEDIIEKLKRSGDIFEPERGLIQRL